MLLKSLKKSLIFSVIAVFCYGLFLSCENPFSNNLGSKVTVEPPAISVASPISGAYIKGVASIEGKATAYRELQRVEAKVFDGEGNTIRDWSADSVTMTGGSREKTWSYTIDTLNFYGSEEALVDGFLKIQFRASDVSLTTYTKEQVYIVKNGPSIVKLTAPDSAKLETESVPPKIGTNTELSGQIIDRRGLKPGYPRIKIWPVDKPEPAGDALGNAENGWGWARLFLTDIDTINTQEEIDQSIIKEWSYADRSQKQVVRVSNFVFRLAEFEIDKDTREVRYIIDGGAYKPLPTKIFNFRIISSDTFFYSDANAKDGEGNSIYLFPRAPIAEDDEVEAVGYYPKDPNGTLDSGVFHSMLLVDSGIRPEIMLDNSDVSPEELEALPNIYITESTAKKTVKESQMIFRLRILAAHKTEPIEKAILEWKHPTAADPDAFGYLEWRNEPGSDGYVEPNNPDKWAEEGHRGMPKSGNFLDGKYFVFLTDGSHTYTSSGERKPVFVSSTVPYSLTVTVYSQSGFKASQKYTLYMDGSTPSVSIRSIIGAYSEPAGDAVDDVDPVDTSRLLSGGKINENPYTVNGNIQVVVDRSASMGLASTVWLVEEDKPDYLTATDTTLSKLRGYFLRPTAAGLASIYENIVEGHMSGIKDPTPNPVSNPYQLKFNTLKQNGDGGNDWDNPLVSIEPPVAQYENRYLWLYVIAQDTVQNLGFTMQKLRVDDSTDLPVLNVSDMDSSITSAEGLFYTDDEGRPQNTDGKNILGIYNGIDLTITDDDGVSRTKDNIEIWLTDLNKVPPLRKQVPSAEIANVMRVGAAIENESSKEWIGSLSQQIMAATLYEGENPLPQYLADGLYKIEISVKDNLDVKVEIIDGERPGDKPTAVKAIPDPQTFFFAVKSRDPVVEITEPFAGETVSEKPVSIKGTVKSPFKLTSLNIAFEPDVISDIHSNDKTPMMPMLWEYDHSEGGNYVYTWEYEKQVNFAPNFAFVSSDRSIEVVAVDGLGVPGSTSVRVVVDNDPPTVRLGEFNFNRPMQAVVEDGTPVMKYVVNGKVPFTINVYDQAGIRDNGSSANICWWVISRAGTAWVAPTWDPATSPALPAGTSGATGRFAINPSSDNNYSALLNTNVAQFPTGTYRLYVIAQDESGNIGANGVLGAADNLLEFTIDQNSDYPVLDNNLTPVNGVYINTITSGGLKISGTVSDDDGFDNSKRGNYVSIRFPTNVTTATPPVITWGDWLSITNVTLGAGGEIDFTYTPPSGTAYPNTHLTGDGTKYYQIQVRDEAAAGPNNNPPGKNPPGTAVPDNATQVVRSRIYPISEGNTTGYSFNIKDVPPQIFFSKYDPTSGTGHNYSAERPAYRTASAMVADLRGGWVIDSYLNVDALTITYSSNGVGSLSLGTLPSTRVTDTDRYNWNITPAMETSLTTHFNAGRNGTHTITIVAEDRVGGSTRVEWSFAKDTEGPVVSGPSDRVIKDDTTVSGTFYDDISPLYTLGADNKPIETFNYRFYASGANPGRWLTDGVIIADSSDTSHRRANWTLPLSELRDGECVVEVLAGDVLGNFGKVTEYINLPGNYTSTTANTNTDYSVSFSTRYFESSTNDNPASEAVGLQVGSIVNLNGALRYVLYVGNNGQTGAELRYQIKVSVGLTGTSATTVYPESGGAINNLNVSVIPGTKFTFTLDRTAPLVSPVNFMTVGGALIGPTPRTMEENERVFSAAGVTQSDGTVTYTLSGLAYDRNLTELIASINPGGGGTTITKTISGTAFETWVKSGTGTYPTDTAEFRVRKATTADRDKHEPKPGETVDIYTHSEDDVAHLYVWELQVNRGDLYRLITPSAGGSATPGERRSITIQARDVAQRNSIRDNWLFYLDDQEPKVEFLNANWNAGGTYTRTTFDRLNLQGTIEDDTFVKSLEFTVAKWDYSLATPAWRYRTAGGTWTGTTADASNSWIELLKGATGKNVTWNLNEETFKDNTFYGNSLEEEGQYKIELRFTDYSLSATPANAGNPGTKSLEFYVDRTPPVITWTSTRKEFYRTADLTFNLSAYDINSIQVPTAQVRLGATNTPVTVSAGTTGTTRTFTVGPITGLTQGSRYTLVLTVTDGAGNVAVTNNTLDFLVDDTPPTLTVTPDPRTAIVGRVEFQGKFNDSLSPISRVGFKTGTAPTVTDIETAIKGKSGNDLNTALVDLGWTLSGGILRTPTTTVPGNVPLNSPLMDIDPGLATAKMTMFDTTRFGNLANIYLTAANQTLDSSLKFDGDDIPAEAKGHTLPLYFLAVDEAGNVTVLTQTYYIYPDGDLPRITVINNPNDSLPEVERLMNGTIRISGTAVDNVRIKNVWFRVMEGTTARINLRIPKWDQETWDPLYKDPTNIDEYYQSSVSKTLYEGSSSTGWYMANGGGSKSVAWWAYINNNNELDPISPATERNIVIEVIAEDTRLNANGDEYFKDGDDGAIFLFPRTAKPVAAKVVLGAPIFDEDWIKMGPSNTNYGEEEDGWRALTAINVTNRAAYALVVQHEMGLGAIRWNQGGTTINLLDESNPYNQNYQATLNDVNAGRAGIAVKAIPRTPITTNQTATGATLNERTFIIWKKGTTVPTVSLQGGGTLSATDNVQYTKFTVTAGSTITVNGATLMQMTADGVFEWVVVADLYTPMLVDMEGKSMAGRGDWYPLKLSASEISKAVPLTTNYEALLPVDNMYPEGVYTHATNVVGTATTFGGEAGDGGMVKGVDRVVLWFSRDVNGTGRSIMWDEIRKDSGGNLISGEFESGGTPEGIEYQMELPDGVEFPKVFNASDVSSDNRSSIVIDRNDPLGRESHHGHQQLRMGFAPGGNLGNTWYVTLNSTYITSGRVTAHYLVYDRAGNVSYFNRKLMILNGRPIIGSVKLATDLRGGTGLGLAGALGVNTTTPRNLANGAANISAPTTNLIGGTAGNSALALIKQRFVDRVTGISTTSSDASVGISDAITINTDRLNDYNVVYDNTFTVRNNLLAARIDLLGTQESTSGKDRTFRFEYVQNVRSIGGKDLISVPPNNAVWGIVAGRMYIIENPGNSLFPWGALGVQGEAPRRGLAFVAMENGNVAIPEWSDNFGTPSVWELNGGYYNNNPTPANADTLIARTYPENISDRISLPDVSYPNTANGRFAEFVYQSTAFSDGILDYNPLTNPNAALSDFNADGRPKAYPFPSVTSTATTQSPHLAHSLFIVRVFDGLESELFGDFALLSIRVNNNDKTKPYAQMYDLNPKTEGVDAQQSVAEALSPGTTVGNNRAKGGLYNEGTTSVIAKSGHIEPRTGTSLTSSEMGGAVSTGAESMQKPFATASVFSVDTVSGKVIVRGYAEDDTKVGSINLELWSTATTPALLQTLNLLTSAGVQNTPPTSPAKLPVVGFMTAASGADISFTEALDLNRHRVEWAYVWNAESVTNTPVGDISIRVVVSSTNAATPNSDPIPHGATNRTLYDYYNPTFPSANAPASTGNFYRYNDIRVNLRPYITGFVRNKTEFAHDTRSRQGRYMFAQSETAVIKGFNLGGAADPTITLPSGAATLVTTGLGTTNGQLSTTANTGGVTAFDLPNNALARYRVFSVPASATTGHGMVTYTVSGYAAVNTDDSRVTPTTDPVGRKPTKIQPWNVEYSSGVAGSDLWDDFTMVHIWSNGNTTGGITDNGSFPIRDGWVPMDPALSVDPTDGTLYSSHNEGGGAGEGTAATNAGFLMGTNNGQTTATTAQQLMRAREPIIHSDIYRTATDTWTVSNIIGSSTSSTDGAQSWTGLGGIYMRGPQGSQADIHRGSVENFYTGGTANGTPILQFYLAESAWYNISTTNTGAEKASSTIQFRNPHIITHIDGSTEHIHVSYFDDKDKSIKYRYNLRGGAGTIYVTGNNATDPHTIPKMWTNLDGGLDQEDRDSTRYAYNTNTIDTNARVVGAASNTSTIANIKDARGSISVGEHNAIAVTSAGHPVIAYYNATNSRLKLAVSKSTAPVLAADWTIRDKVIPDGNPNQFGTGQYVSIAIDTRAGTTQNTIHIAAMHTNGNLVYIKGHIDSTATGDAVLTGTIVQVVDNVGTVGRWCKISLDEDGNPWIAYQDAGYIASRDGVKTAYYNPKLFIKGSDKNNYEDEDIDVNGDSITGWEAMHVPTGRSVENTIMGTGEQGHIGLECYPPRNYTGSSASKAWNAAVGYLSTDRYRIMYYVK